jgi:hypothetical protein
LCLTAASGELAVVAGRRTGSQLGKLLGPEWGAVVARAVIGLGAVGGATSFAILCFVSLAPCPLTVLMNSKDHISPIKTADSASGRLPNLPSLLVRAGAYGIHVYYGEKLWSHLLDDGLSVLLARPEKTVRPGLTYIEKSNATADSSHFGDLDRPLSLLTFTSLV